MIKAVIFDMDGLMFDTEKLYDTAWEYAGKQFGYVIKQEDLNPMRGANQALVQDLFYKKFGPEFDFMRIRKSRIEYMEQYIGIHGLPHKPGLTELLEYLKEKGYQMAVATSTPEEPARRYLTMEGVADYFDVCIYGDMAAKSKPDPEIYIKALKQMGREPKECLVLEDSPNGVLAGFQAGCSVVMIPDAIQPDHADKQRTVRILPNLNEVISYLESQPYQLQIYT
ncbi:hydrolase [Lacrimispora amygdalina]|uniref:Hydrolase n=1 Tax=Lacrimispora amygdalina TaxID=253257 RepID=A0ABQ5M8G0_9FIRM